MRASSEILIAAHASVEDLGTGTSIEILNVPLGKATALSVYTSYAAPRWLAGPCVGQGSRGRW